RGRGHVGVPGAARPRGRGGRPARRPRPRRRPRPVDLPGRPAHGRVRRTGARRARQPGAGRVADPRRRHRDPLRRRPGLGVPADQPRPRPGGGARVRRAAARRARALADDPQAQVLGPPHAHRRRRSHGRRARWARPHRPGGLRRGVRPAAGGPARPARGELMLTELATFSDRLSVAAAGIYALAMIFHAVEFAAARAKSPALVGAGAPAEESTRTRPERFGRMAVAVTVLGAALHLVSLATRGLAAERWPMGNMYEFISAICLAAVVPGLRVLG